MVTSKREFNKMLSDWIKTYEKVIEQALLYAGEAGLNRARSVSPAEGSYNDQTGNLRSSIGYVVFKGGMEVLTAGFLETNGTEKGAKGKVTGKEFLESIKVNYGGGYQVIMVAGMNYSGYVEANYDVLTSAEIKARRELIYVLQN